MLEVYEELLSNWIEQAIENASDDHMFATGYLQGHLAVAFSKMEQSGETSLDVLYQEMTVCLDEARSELSPEDYCIVQDVWNDIQSHFESHFNL